MLKCLLKKSFLGSMDRVKNLLKTLAVEWRWFFFSQWLNIVSVHLHCIDERVLKCKELFIGKQKLSEERWHCYSSCLIQFLHRTEKTRKPHRMQF